MHFVIFTAFYCARVKMEQLGVRAPDCSPLTDNLIADNCSAAVKEP